MPGNLEWHIYATYKAPRRHDLHEHDSIAWSQPPPFELVCQLLHSASKLSGAEAENSRMTHNIQLDAKKRVLA
eukprot:scaffold29352_cov21-Tisochrysis_lutea.AAC.1